jgi:actin-related protein
VNYSWKNLKYGVRKTKQKVPINKYFSLEFCLPNQGALVLQTTNQRTGLVVDIGHDVGHVVPICTDQFSHFFMS